MIIKAPILLYKKINAILNKGQERSVKAKKNILASFGVKGFSILNGFLLVSVTLNFLDQTRYGLWLIFANLIFWISFFEIGLGKGLRNKLTISLAEKNYELGRKLVSTTYFLMGLIFSVLLVIFWIVNPFINWHAILNVPSNISTNINQLALIAISGLIIRVYVQLINNVFYADQRPAFANAINPISNFIGLATIFVMVKLNVKGDLIKLALIMVTIPIIIYLCVNILAFTKKYKSIAPSIRSIDLSLSKGLLSLGSKFFMLSISGLILFQSSNILIAQYFSPNEVTTYNIAYKSFATTQMIFTIIMTPFWSAFTDAWALQDLTWIKRTVKKITLSWSMILMMSVVLLIFSKIIFKIWVGDIHIPMKLSIYTAIYFVYLSFGLIFSQFVNGLGKIKLQIASSLIGAFLFIPVSYVLVKYYHMGIEGILISSIICNFYGPILGPIQYYLIVNKKDKGIWSK